MKRIFVFIIFSVFALSNFACTPAESKSNPEDKDLINSKKIEIYYFHYTRRCQTCNAVEDVTKDAIKEYFSEKVKSGIITFKSINLDEDAGEEIAKKLNVSGQTLLFVSSSEKINLTNDAFMYAKNQPDKLKEKVKKTVESLL